MGKHEYTTLDRARDELFSHIQRCEVLEADRDEHIEEWLDETMEFMAERYPDLTDLQLAQLKMMGERYLQPVIPHGRETNALDREDVEKEPVEVGEEAAEAPEAEAAEAETEPSEEEAPESVEPPEAVTSTV